MKSIGGELLQIPNTIRGRFFLWWFKRYFNKRCYKMKLRGRGNRRGVARRQHEWIDAYSQDLPVIFCERIAVYVDMKFKGV
jgi:hypothetical protein